MGRTNKQKKSARQVGEKNIPLNQNWKNIYILAEALLYIL